MDADVSVLCWPADDALRQQLAWFGLPRVLLVDVGTDPPHALDDLEDWMRTPADPVDLRARADALRRRAGAPAHRLPVVDGDGLLWVGTRWVALSPVQAPVVQLFVDNLDRVVRFDAVVAAYEAAGGSGHPAAARTLIARLGVRLRTVGLELVSVRRRGVLLTATSARRGLRAEPASAPPVGARSAAVGP